MPKPNLYLLLYKKNNQKTFYPKIREEFFSNENTNKQTNVDEIGSLRTFYLNENS